MKKVRDLVHELLVRGRVLLVTENLLGPSLFQLGVDVPSAIKRFKIRFRQREERHNMQLIISHYFRI